MPPGVIILKTSPAMITEKSPLTLPGMKIMPNSKNKAITLVELILAILLMSTIVLAGYSLELTMRNMSVAPRVETKLLDELVPIMELIKKNFEFESTGNFTSPSVQDFSGCAGTGLQIRTGGPYSSVWHGYCWKSGDYSFEYDDGSGNSRVIGYDISNFAYELAENYTRLSVEISAMKDPSEPENVFTNPEVTLNSTFYARAVSGS